MKSSYAILSLLLVSIIASVAVPASALVNLLQNPGFEDNVTPPTIPYPWEANTIGDGIVGVLLTNVHTGTYAAGMGGGDGAGWIWQDIDPPRCAEYLEFWYISSIGKVTIFYTDGTSHVEGLPDTGPPYTTWTFIHINLDTTKLVERVEVIGGGYGGVNVDDFDLEACAVPSVPEFSLSLPLLISVAAVPLLILYHRKNLTYK